MKVEPKSGHPLELNGPALEIDSDIELLARCRAGDAVSWQRLYDAQFEFVQRICRRLGTPDSELDDSVQDVFIVAFKKLDDFTEGRVSTWLYRIAANIVSGRHRRRRIRKTLLGLFGAAPPEPVRPVDRDYDAREAQAQVAGVLESMAPKKREVFALFELEGLSGDEIAERIGCKVETVWTRLHYARADFEKIAKKRGLP